MDEGVLVLILYSDRRMRIETGYGSEGDLPDAICFRIINNFFTPSFKENNYEKGIELGLKEIIKVFDADFEWIGGPEESEDAIRFVLPEEVPWVWDPDNLLKPNEIEELSAFLKSISVDEWKYYFALKNRDNNQDESLMYDVFSAYRNAFSYEDKFVVVCCSPNDPKYLLPEIKGLTFFDYIKNDEKEYPIFKSKMDSAKQISINELNKGNVVNGFSSYFSTLDTSLHSYKKSHFWDIFWILFAIFGIVIIIIIWAAKTKTTGTTGKGVRRSSSSSSSGTSFGGGSSGGGGAKGHK